MYVKLDFWRFLIGLVVVALPAWMLDRSGRQDQANTYVWLILLSLLIANWRGVEAFTDFIRREM